MGGDGVFRAALTGQKIGEQIRHKQHRLRLFEHPRFILPQISKLENGVETGKLDAGSPVKLLGRDGFKDLFHHTDGAAVPVMHRVAHKLPLFIEKAEIHAPGVNPYGIEAALLQRLGDALLDFKEQPQNIPIEHAAHHHRIVGKPVDFLQGNPAVLVLREDGAAARRAEVKREYSFSCQQPALLSRGPCRGSRFQRFARTSAS